MADKIVMFTFYWIRDEGIGLLIEFFLISGLVGLLESDTRWNEDIESLLEIISGSWGTFI